MVAMTLSTDTRSAETALDLLQRRVIQGGYCVGCGACAVVAPQAIKIEWTSDGTYEARVTNDLQSVVPRDDVLAVCPFSGESANEDDLSAELFPLATGTHDRIGRYERCFAGRVTHQEAFLHSSSGGLGKWILGQLLERNLVDAVVQVCDENATKDGEPLFRYEVVENLRQLGRGSKSAYYPVELSGVLRHIRENEGRYAITGVPCFIKAIRLLCRTDAVLNRRIRYAVGLVCGHLKSSFYAEMLGWQLGVKPSDLGSVDFRAKMPGKKANEKGVIARTRGGAAGESEGKTVQQLFGTNYGQGFFKYKACDYCDDVVAEAADVSIGDAWLPRYMEKGTSLVIVRKREILEILQAGVGSGSVQLDEITADEAALSQDAGLRHRRQGLSFRLRLKQVLGVWYPAKRVRAGSLASTLNYKLVIALRMVISRASAPAFRLAKHLDSWAVFRFAMAPWVLAYSMLYRIQHAQPRQAVLRRLHTLRKMISRPT
jgi:coenzyme F420 hydrogenase subunit beta